jgi:sulfite exporter TauE/SafE
VTLALSLFLLGLASGVHCVGMCGGFVAAFQGIPIRQAEPARGRRLALFNAGRISTYALLGAAAGLAGGEITLAFGAHTALYVFANLMLIGVGLYLAGAAQWFAGIERIGAPLWRHVQPVLAKRLNGRGAYVAGLLWGLLPCGLVYAALATAALAGSAAGGAAAMAAYGLGTAPWLLGAGLAFGWLQKKAVRAAAGGVVLAFGVLGLAHAAMHL